MRKERILAVIMSVLLALSMIPVTVFAAETSVLDGKLKIQGSAAEGKILSADFKEVKPEGVAEDDVTYLWERKTTEDEAAEKAGDKPELKELSKEKTYTVTQEDVGSKIVLTVTGKEENGYSGNLKIVSDTVIDAQTVAEQETKATEDNTTADENTESNQSQNTEEAADSQQAETPEGTDESMQEDSDQASNEAIDGIPAATTDEEKQQQENAGSEAVEGIPEATEDGTYDQQEISDKVQPEDTVTPDEPTEISTDATIIVGDGSTESIDFGTVISGQEDSVQAQYVTVSNTGNTILNFAEISPEHFMVQDISNPMEPNSSQQLWIVPRAGVEVGSYDDTITYTSEEGVKVSFEARMTVKAPEDDKSAADSGGAADSAQNDQNTDTEKPADNSDTDNSDNTDNTDNGKFTSGVTLAVDEAAGSGLNFNSNNEQTIVLTNNSEQTMTVTASVTGDMPAVTVAPAEQEISAGGTATFTATPAENLEAETPYQDAILFAQKDNIENSVLVSVNVTLQAPKVSHVTADRTSPVDFGTLVQGYTERPAAEQIILKNEGNAEADLTEAVSDTGAAQGQYFDISWQAQQLAPDNTAVVKIQPKADLPGDNTYTESFTITDNTNNSLIVITATVNVEKEKHSVDPSTSSLDFATVKKGYGEAEKKEFTVINNGNVTETLEQPTLTNFTVSVSQLTLAPGESATYTVQPKTGLDVGAYAETIKISSDKSVGVNFQVAKGNAVLTKIQQPAAVTGLANGTKKSASSLKLPSTVVIETTEGNMKASVSWNVKASSYRQSSTDAQKFTVSGTVALPSGVDNDNKINLTTSVEVSVNAYSAQIASAENNKITGIEPNGIYTTQTKISFTAVGAGMDNNSPKKGDTRYVPQSWTVINTNAWNAAPYTASFGLAQSGDYTLKVAFAQQQYDGNTWKSTGTTDTRQVSFSITKAKVTAPGTNLTPAANKKSSVKTGDNTPILPFVCILIIAAGAIGGVVVYKKKNKK